LSDVFEAKIRFPIGRGACCEHAETYQSHPVAPSSTSHIQHKQASCTQPRVNVTLGNPNSPPRDQINASSKTNQTHDARHYAL
jgi:hypothetical protein